MTNYINGKWQEGLGKHFQSINPTDASVIWQGNAATLAEINSAVESARKAFPSWARLSVEQRISYLEKFVQVVETKKEELAEALTKDVGKPLWEARTEVSSFSNKFKISVEAYQDRCKERKLPFGGTDTFSITRHKPHGVLAVFGPYNFPMHTPNGHIMPALIAGNTLVFKPSELTPFSSELMIKCWAESGLPAGVLNLVQGEVETGMHLSAHHDIDGILFTGSSRTGKLIHKQFAGDTAKILALEMGGNNPLIVHQVNDLKAAAYMVIQSAFLTSGQRCTCARRLILIDSEESHKLLNLLVEMTSKIKIGDPMTDVFMGPVISERQATKIYSAYKDLSSKGATTLLEPKLLDFRSKAFISPTIIDVSEVRDLEDEEVFGPLLQVHMVKDWDAAIEKANATKYGLSSGLISDNAQLFEDFFFRIKAGLINWNNQVTGASSNAPFGGIGDSGNHRPSAYYAADYCGYPVASLESSSVKLPEKLSPGLSP